VRAKGQAQRQDGRRRVTLTPRLAGAQRPETPTNDGVYWQQVGNPTLLTLHVRDRVQVTSSMGRRL